MTFRRWLIGHLLLTSLSHSIHTCYIHMHNIPFVHLQQCSVCMCLIPCAGKPQLRQCLCVASLFTGYSLL